MHKFLKHSTKETTTAEISRGSHFYFLSNETKVFPKNIELLRQATSQYCFLFENLSQNMEDNRTTQSKIMP